MKKRTTKKTTIPAEVKAQVDEQVEKFNRETFQGDPLFYFVARYRGDCAYFDMCAYGRVGPRCRLQYKGQMDNWEFAIYKYSREYYDPDEWFFPGSKHVDGTVEGALRAGLEAYPV
jgi:hypothetical protein